MKKSNFNMVINGLQFSCPTKAAKYCLKKGRKKLGMSCGLGGRDEYDVTFPKGERVHMALVNHQVYEIGSHKGFLKIWL